ncbi:hypothetical protein KNE206_57110 [Kitasatospora sp. NE20-6]
MSTATMLLALASRSANRSTVSPAPPTTGRSATTKSIRAPSRAVPDRESGWTTRPEIAAHSMPMPAMPFRVEEAVRAVLQQQVEFPGCPAASFIRVARSRAVA